MLRRINHNKGVVEQNLYHYIPSDITTFYQINKSKDFNGLISFFEPIEDIISSLQSEISYPLIIIDYVPEYAVVFKITGEQESIVKDILSKKLFNSFPPKKRTYKGIDIFFYPSSDESFFSCMFYNGIFVGGYNSRIIERIIDHISSQNREEHLSKDLLSFIKSNYPINVYSKDQDQVYILNGSFKSDNTLDFTGFICQADTEQDLLFPFETEKDSILIDNSIFDDNILSYSVSFRNNFIADNIGIYFDSVAYQIRVNPTSNYVSFLKYNQDRFDIFNKLNEIEQRYTAGRKLNMRDVVLNKQHVYTASGGLSKTVFRSDVPITFMFYKGYLIFSDNRIDLIDYLKLREKDVTDSEKQEYIDLKTYDELFRSRNISNEPNIPLKHVWNILGSRYSSIEILYSFNSPQCYKISFVLNN